MEDRRILEMRSISKEFPGVKALDNVELTLHRGRVCALMGENGAGKSTLMKVLLGIYTPNSGKITFKGEEVVIKNPHEALNMGISMIHQELNPVIERSIMENIWLGREPLRGKVGLVDHKKMYSDTEKLLKELELDLDPKEKMRNLTVAQMQMVEIVKAVSYNSEIVIMDEPTSSLTSKEVEHLFRIIEKLKEQNKAIVYISHKMDEIYRIADDITIFRDGKYIGTYEAKDVSREQLINLMVGREIKDMFPKTECTIGDVKIKVENLSAGNVFENINFEVKKGEILGFAGLVGSGRTEVMETLFGVRRKSGGKITIDNKEVEINTPNDGIKNKIAMLTEDRRDTGIFPMLSVKDNIVISNMDLYLRGILLNNKKIQKDCEKYKSEIRIKTPSITEQIKNLSGGNQQKVLIARWLLTEPEILILDEPTRGIDVGAKSEIHSLISTLASQGKSIILISSELPEILGMSDRIVVMHEGKITGILNRGEATQELIMKYATGNVPA